MTINPGETTIFVGPSGCGKTTTMRMINRLIEPTSGRITIGGEDALSLNPDELRRRIGYAIQQAGLFPHLTVAQNVGVVPGLLGWDKTADHGPRRGDARRWSAWTPASSATATRASSPAASSSASASPGRWPRTRRCC